MKLLPLDISERQASKLRNGHKVRVKHGSGFNVLVHPDTYSLMTRTFKKGKGAELKLADEEIQANKALTPESHQAKMDEETDGFHMDKLIGGGSLFKTIGSKLQKFGRSKTGQTLLKIAKPLAKAGVNALAKVAVDSTPKQYQPLTKAVAGVASSEANKGISGLGISVDKHKRLHELNKHIGSNMGYLGRANIDNAVANGMSAGMAKSAIDMRHTVVPGKTHWDEPNAPPSRGSGIHPSSMRSRGVVQGRGALHHGDHGLPPALISQPHGANFQFQHFLPPQYQHIHASGGGLYL